MKIFLLLKFYSELFVKKFADVIIPRGPDNK